MGDRDTVFHKEVGPRDEVHFVTPFIAAYPNPLVLRAGTRLARNRPVTGTSVLSWWLRNMPSADLYAYPPGGAEQFLGTKRSDGSVRSGAIALGQTYRWKIFPTGDKTNPYDEEEVTALELDLPVGAGPLGHPPKNENTFSPTNLVTRGQHWYHREVSPAGGPFPGPFVRGLGPDSGDWAGSPDEVLVGYVHSRDEEGWFGADYEQSDTFWRGGLQFDAAAIQRYVQRWGMAAATLKFRVSRGDSSCLARIEQAGDDMTDWEPVAEGVLPSDGTAAVDLPVGPLRNAVMPLYKTTSTGLITADVGVIAYRWQSFPDLPHAFALIGPDERFVPDDDSSFLTSYSYFGLEITPSPFL